MDMTISVINTFCIKWRLSLNANYQRSPPLPFKVNKYSLQNVNRTLFYLNAWKLNIKMGQFILRKGTNPPQRKTAISISCTSCARLCLVPASEREKQHPIASPWQAWWKAATTISPKREISPDPISHPFQVHPISHPPSNSISLRKASERLSSTVTYAPPACLPIHWWTSSSPKASSVSFSIHLSAKSAIF